MHAKGRAVDGKIKSVFDSRFGATVKNAFRTVLSGVSWWPGGATRSGGVGGWLLVPFASDVRVALRVLVPLGGGVLSLSFHASSPWRTSRCVPCAFCCTRCRRSRLYFGVGLAGLLILRVLRANFVPWATFLTASFLVVVGIPLVAHRRSRSSLESLATRRGGTRTRRNEW